MMNSFNHAPIVRYRAPVSEKYFPDLLEIPSHLASARVNKLTIGNSWLRP
jgi:hypothetical protein